MSRTVSLVQRVEIASPCPVSWDSMTGDDQVRFCGQCQLNVFNLSEMTAEEGERLIIEKEGRLCARIYRRRDGTVLTRDCPVGLAAMRRRMIGFAVAVTASVMFVAGAAMSCIFGQRSEGWFLNEESAFSQASNKLRYWMNGAPTQQWLGGVVSMGSMACPPPPPTSIEPLVGRPALSDSSISTGGFRFPLNDPSNANQ